MHLGLKTAQPQMAGADCRTKEDRRARSRLRLGLRIEKPKLIASAWFKKCAHLRGGRTRRQIKRRRTNHPMSPVPSDSSDAGSGVGKANEAVGISVGVNEKPTICPLSLMPSDDCRVDARGIVDLAIASAE